LPTHISTQKKIKRACNPTHKNKANLQEQSFDSKEALAITAPTQKTGFRVPKTVLWLMKV